MACLPGGPSSKDWGGFSSRQLKGGFQLQSEQDYPLGNGLLWKYKTWNNTGSGKTQYGQPVTMTMISFVIQGCLQLYLVEEDLSTM